MPQVVTLPHLTERAFKQLLNIPGVERVFADIIGDRVIREFPADKYSEEFQKPTPSDIEELFRRMPEAEDKAVNIVMNPMEGAWHKWKVKRR